MADIRKLPTRDERGENKEARTPVEAQPVEEVPALPMGRERAFGEFYDELENNLVLRSSQAGVRSLMLTGTDSGVGVSTIAARFAESVSFDPTIRVILVDAHVRNPSLHQRFDLSDSDSFYGLLTGKERVASLAPARVGNLYVLPAGETRADPRVPFRRRVVRDIVRELVDSFDLVIFDAPCINDCIEARTLAAQVDGVTLVVRAGETTRRKGRLAMHQIESSGTPLIGVVLNRARSFVPAWIYDRF